MTLEVVTGDLFDPDFGFDALAQGVNTYGIMGGGIAADFRDRYPDMHESYQQFCQTYRAVAPGMVHYYPGEWGTIFWKDSDPDDPYEGYAVSDEIPVIFNLFTQVEPGKDQARLSLVERSSLQLRLMIEALSDLTDNPDDGITSVGLPWIGCGIGGLDKHNVLHVLESTLGPSDTDFVIVEQP